MIRYVFNSEAILFGALMSLSSERRVVRHARRMTNDCVY